jgi:hypothetical protein
MVHPDGRLGLDLRGRTALPDLTTSNCIIRAKVIPDGPGSTIFRQPVFLACTISTSVVTPCGLRSPERLADQVLSRTARTTYIRRWRPGRSAKDPAFRRGTFVVTALDGRPLSWRGSRG